MSIPNWLRSWAGVTAVLSFAAGTIGTLTLALEIGHPFGGYLSYSIALDEVGHVAVGTPAWWPIYDVEPNFGGDLHTINGLPYTSNLRATFSQSEPGSSVSILSQLPGDEQAHSEDVPAILFTAGYFLDVKLPDLIVAVAFGLLSILVLRTAPAERTNQVFAALTSLIFAHRLLNVHTLFIDNTLVPNLLEATLRLVSALTAATMFHFAWLYPSPLPKRPRWLIKLFYVAAVIVALPLIAARFTWWPPGIIAPNVTLNSIAFQALIYLYLIGLAAILGRLVYSAIRENETKRERRILLVTAVGVLLALPFTILLSAEVIPGIEPDFYRNFLDLRILFIAIPFAFALAIIRYQNLTAPSPIFVIVAVLAASALLANIASWLWQVAPPDKAEVQALFVPFFVIILSASLFWSLQTTWSGWMGRFFQRESLNYEATRNVGRRLQKTSDLRALPHVIARSIADELELDDVSVWLANPRTGSFELSAQAGESQKPLPVRLDLPDEYPGTFPLRVSGAAQTPAWLQSLVVHRGLEIVVLLYNEAEPIALLGFGSRWDEDVFDDRDLVVIELVSQQAQLYLQVARQIDELRQVPHLVSQAQERERTLLAAELHDTIQQFLGRLPFFLVTSKESMDDDPQAAAELLERSLADIQEAAITVQEIRQNLAPSQLEHSLYRSLNALAARTSQRHGIDVLMDLNSNLDEATTMDTRLALYRVIQHALDNAAAHSDAAEVMVNVQLDNGAVRFAVSDLGRGVAEQELALARNRGQFGLQSMQARIEACGGEFTFRSAIGEGTRVTGWVPSAIDPTI